MKYRFVRICLLLVITLSAALSVSAQKDKNVTFKANIPNAVAVGEVFSIDFTSNVSGIFSPPSFGDNVEVLAGPQQSVRNEVIITNGSFTQESRHTITYVLRSNSEGEFTVGAASWTANGVEYSTKPVTVKVVKERGASANNGGGNQTGSSERQGQNQNGASSVQKDDILLMAVVDKSSVYKGEPIKVTYKLYTAVACNLVDAKLPSFNGFWAQQIDTSNYQMRREEYNGRLYNTHVIYETLLFPQQIGDLTIDRFEITAIVQIIKEPSRNRSALESLLSGPEIHEEKLRLSSSALKISVKDFPPGAPLSFSGAVGNFKLSSEPLPVEINANTAFTYKINLSGQGNLPQIQAPKLTLPSTFEQYNVTTTGSLNNSSNGVSGYRQFEYPIIARAEGEYTIGELEFSFLNPRTSKYETLRIPEATITVLPDTNSGSNGNGGILVSGISKEDVKILGSDIRFIKGGVPHFRTRDKALMPSGLYVLIALIIVSIFVFLLYFLRKKLQEMRNNALVRGRKANKVALYRFKAAEQYMKQDNQRGFYEEMLKALWGYMSDKLNIPVAHLTKDNIRGELIKKGISEDLATHYVNIIGECEYAQYAPVTHGKMNEIYVSGVEVVTELESVLGK